MMTALLLTAWATSTGLLISCRAPAPRCCATDGAAASFRQRLREVNVDPALLSEVTTIVAHKSGVASRHKRPDGPMGQYELRAGAAAGQAIWDKATLHRICSHCILNAARRLS